ncbi:MAG: ATP-dependent DNA helicase [Candidatus Peregrinibacteria bacterium]|nr:ATP-dependent DNA helicase [Candidatus Peregrinibacteria bacterium]MDZ4244750.1 ATP-dependent DNA helicase [Candidatus Gracilibacteria bacterium]
MTTIFQQRLEKLNPEQRKAVEAIEGPVMVIAGPGTGKTEVLSARIANILQSTDAGPHNILCLTFTDAGTIAMRKRLLEFIGPEAYKVNIYTFHAFCNDVIQENLDYFEKRELSLVSELEVVQFLEKLIDKFQPDHPLYHVSSYYEVGRLKDLFQTMKAENWTTSDVIAASDEYLKNLPNDPEFQYKRANSSKGVKVGDPNDRLISPEIEKIEKLKAGAKEFDNYQKFLNDKERYDYQDMIAWIVKAFKEDENMLATYQERFLYILVDEYQDTNGAQNEIINLLTNFWDSPNIFIVGDDDQSIYRFQGANLRNIMSFYHTHPTSEKVMITQNYRSSQNILNSAMSLIEGNNERLINEIPGLEKNLTASNAELAGSETKTRVFEYYNTAHEEAGIVEIIEKLHKSNIDLNEVAIIYSQHRQAYNIIKLLEQKKIPLNVKESTNILDLPFAKTIINILTYIAGEFENPYSMESVLFHILHYDFFKISVRDIAMLSAKLRQLESEHRAQKKSANLMQLPTLEPKLRELITDEATIRDLISIDSQEKLLKLGEGLNKWIRNIPHMTLQELIETIFSEGGILEYVMNAEDKVWHMRILTTFFDFIKEESRKNPNTSLKDLLQMLKKMEEHGISLPLAKMTFAKNGVNFITAHSSKGLEFKYVFIIGCQKKIWDSSRANRGSFSFPNTLTLSNTGDDTEEARRLFYVAMTRAKKHLVISYSARDMNDKDIEMSQFVAEVIENSKKHALDIHIEPCALSDESMMSYYSFLMSSQQVKNNDIIEEQYITDLLKDYKLSPTHLNKYLECPIAFYFENVLRVPRPLNEYMAFGNSIHYALEHFFKNTKKHGSFDNLDRLIQYFTYYMDLNRSSFTEIQFEKRSAYGAKVLEEYFNHYKSSWTPNVRVEYNVWQAQIDGVPITGKIDKIEFENTEANIVDYKTGQYSNSIQNLKAPSEAEPLGGNYWRQIVFYKILTDSDKKESWNMTSGEMDFVERDSKSGEFKKVKMEVSHEDVEIVKAQIKDTYTKIMNHQFSQGCGKEDCQWCNFVKQEYRVGASN